METKCNLAMSLVALNYPLAPTSIKGRRGCDASVVLQNECIFSTWLVHLLASNLPSTHSTGGFVLGGILFFVSIFDTTRKPIITFFDQVFGSRQARRRRDVSSGLETKVAEAFDTFTAAVDKMNAVLMVAKEFK